ncbi:hypothetical protein PRZ48_002270 [Zasmidium cellare]|uniref:Uncharacterized protein n=1 Tax=Zasmidium cellare TaxID=395010 RepID=A0ABR0F3K0_ZASCE|nr:hypothetical protein PRZ48_002270 [Zasmidium cellare]
MPDDIREQAIEYLELNFDDVAAEFEDTQEEGLTGQALEESEAREMGLEYGEEELEKILQTTAAGQGILTVRKSALIANKKDSERRAESDSKHTTERQFSVIRLER